MAFGGIGAAAALIQDTSIAPPGQYASQVNGPVSAIAADNIFWQKNRVERRSEFNEFVLTVDAELLLARIAGFNLANADSGRFTSAEPAANEHGLPANFGPGRGNWLEGDAERILVDLRFPHDQAQGGAGETPLIDVTVTVANGDVQIDVHNHGGQDITADKPVLRVRYDQF